MRSPISPYEVRCSGCNATFPIGTRDCIHCGGVIVAQDTVDIRQSIIESTYETSEGVSEPIELTPAYSDASDTSDEADELADEPSSIGRSLIRSLGGFIWVIVLIGFTLARNCGGE